MVLFDIEVPARSPVVKLAPAELTHARPCTRHWMPKNGEAMVPELGLSWQVARIDGLPQDFSAVV